MAYKVPNQWKQNDLNKVMAGQEPMNLNWSWLTLIMFHVYAYSMEEDTDLIAKLKRLRKIKMLIAPEIDMTEITILLNDIELKIEEIAIKDANGKVIKFSSDLFRDLDRRMEDILEKILKKLNDVGLLKYKGEDPSRAAGKFFA